MGLRDIPVKCEYRSLLDDVVSDFYNPLLREACLYQRAVGFFSSSAFALIASGIDGLIQNGGKIQIIASPNLSAEDVQEIAKGYEVRAIIERALLRSLAPPKNELEAQKLSYIAQLIADDKLDIKIAVLTSSNDIAMYHEKVGIISDKSGDVIAFSGSMNESGNAFQGNYESFDVFCSWVGNGDSERVFRKQMAFRAIWEDYEPGVSTLDFPEAVKKHMLTYRRHATPNSESGNMPDVQEESGDFEMHLPEDFAIRPYQENAIASWKNNHYQGIYDMATGTGKTLTALASIEQLYRDNGKRLAVIIACPYQHLVEQWVEDIERFGMHPIIGYSSSVQKRWKKNLEQAVRSFNLGVINHFCFITTNASFATKYVQTQIDLLSADTVFVVDEAHNMGASNYRKILPEQIEYRLGLSATIDRHNDEAGSLALTTYFGPKCIEYSLRDAIDNGMLTPYYFHPVMTYLDEDELDNYLILTTQIAKGISKKNGKTVLSEYAKQLLIKRSRIIAGARNKLSVLKNEIQPYIEDKHILVYCGATSVQENDIEGEEFATRQIDVVSQMLGNDLNMRIGRFTSQESSQERAQIRTAFADGELLQALVAIKCLDEGVNIPSIKTAFILASSTNPKEYIQRRGRVLRKFPGKDYAVIFDFITLPFELDAANYLNPEVVNASKGLVKRELVRMLDFAEISENPSEAYEIIHELKECFGITEDELRNTEVDDDVI